MADAQPELKAGHPPAVKAGGMRITQHKPPKEEKPKEKPEEVEEAAGSPPKQPPLVISGAVVKGDAEFTPEAVQSFHNKPAPQVDRRNSGGHKNVIHQPRK
jgi:hypothetical protein